MIQEHSVTAKIRIDEEAIMKEIVNVLAKEIRNIMFERPTFKVHMSDDLKDIVKASVKEIMDEHKEQIIKETVNNLAKRLGNTNDLKNAVKDIKEVTNE